MSMAKRSAVRRVRAEYQARDQRDAGSVHLNVIEGGWDPLYEDDRYTRRKKRNHPANDHHRQQQQQRDPQRDQHYVKNVQAKSEGQARLIEAIDRARSASRLVPPAPAKPISLSTRQF